MRDRPRTVGRQGLRISRAVRSALPKIPWSAVLEFVRGNPNGSVFDFCQAHLAGLYPRAAGVTRVAYNSIYNRLANARRRLGLAPPTKTAKLASNDHPAR